MLTCARCSTSVPDQHALVDHLATEHLLAPKRAEAEALVFIFEPGHRVCLNEQGRRLASSQAAKLRLGTVDRIGKHTGEVHVRWDGLKTGAAVGPILPCPRRWATAGRSCHDPEPKGDGIQEDMMAKIARSEIDRVDIDEQPPLVPMSDEELRTAGRKLAMMIRELDDIRGSHAAVRAEQKAERETLGKKIASLAQTIVQQGR
jgi:hypothetical protein